MLWINLLHLYQPANSDPVVIKEATEKSYNNIVSYLEKYPETKFTLNISGCLVSRWKEMGYNDFIKRIRLLVDAGQIELTGSAFFHPLLPLIPGKEMIHQIDKNNKILKDTFGSSLALRGFFLPELAYSKEVALSIKEFGFEWIVVDEIAYNGKLGGVDIGKVYYDKNSELKTIFRSRNASNNYAPSFLQDNKKLKNPLDPVITVTDGEIYGLRYVDNKKIFGKVLKDDNISTKTISEYIDSYRKGKEDVSLVACSWESTEKEIVANKPYIVWYDKNNKIHKKIWKLVYLAYDAMEKFDKDSNYKWARWHFVRGLASCVFWWSSAKDFSHIFGPHAWSPDEIERGLNELIRSVRSLEDEDSKKYKLKAEKLYINIKKMIWKHHWLYYWKKMNQ